MKFSALGSSAFTALLVALFSAITLASCASNLAHNSWESAADGQPTALILSAISPSSGPTTGGTVVTLKGKGFKAGTQVTFGNSNATAVTLLGDTELRALAPPSPSGAVNVTVSTSDGQSAILDKAFKYLDAPTTTSIYPDSGLSQGGTLVTIAGTNFRSGARVRFGNEESPTTVFMTNTLIQAVTPPQAAGPSDVTVENPDGGSSTLPGGFRFGEILFADGFESNDFSAWRAVSKFGCSTDGSYAVTPNRVHRGGFAAEFHYRMPADQCGEHEDSDILVMQAFDSLNGHPNGLEHFFLRGYVYIKYPEVGGTADRPGRKLFYIWADPSGPGTYWSLILGARGNGGTNTLSFAVQSSPIGGSSMVFDCGTTPKLCADLSYDTWHYIELEIQNSTVTAPPWNGVGRIWVDGQKVLESTGFSFNRGLNYPLKYFNIGEQVDRNNYDPVDEYRYWDDIVIADAYIGP